jgi:NAD(P)H dehydrogenase (quinone)
MKHLIVGAHPAEDSFTITIGLTRAYAAELEKCGQSQRTCDLYRMGFNPVLTARELAADHPAEADVAQAQSGIRTADVLTLVYPLWWMSMPAMMKGYIDRVFAFCFGYEADDGVVHGLFSGKKAVLITISGAPLPVLMKNGRWNAMEVLQDTHILRSTGFALLEHRHFDEIAPHLPRAVAEQHMASVRSCVTQRSLAY